MGGGWVTTHSHTKYKANVPKLQSYDRHEEGILGRPLSGRTAR
jgi:hypothetical protein